jgi:hypothetical protein
MTDERNNSPPNGIEETDRCGKHHKQHRIGEANASDHGWQSGRAVALPSSMAPLARSAMATGESAPPVVMQPREALQGEWQRKVILRDEERACKERERGHVRVSWERGINGVRVSWERGINGVIVHHFGN